MKHFITIYLIGFFATSIQSYPISVAAVEEKHDSLPKSEVFDLQDQRLEDNAAVKNNLEETSLNMLAPELADKPMKMQNEHPLDSQQHLSSSEATKVMIQDENSESNSMPTKSQMDIKDSVLESNKGKRMQTLENDNDEDQIKNSLQAPTAFEQDNHNSAQESHQIPAPPEVEDIKETVNASEKDEAEKTNQCKWVNVTDVINDVINDDDSDVEDLSAPTLTLGPMDRSLRNSDDDDDEDDEECDDNEADNENDDESASGDEDDCDEDENENDDEADNDAEDTEDKENDCEEDAEVKNDEAKLVAKASSHSAEGYEFIGAEELHEVSNPMQILKE